MTLQLSKSSHRWLIGITVTATLLTSGLALYISRPSSQPIVAPTAAMPRNVAALGRIEPEAEVIKLSAPLALDGDRVAQLLVKEGDFVQAGQVVAILDSRSRLTQALRQAEEQVQVAQAKLAQVKAGAKTAEIQAQQAEIRQLEADLIGEQASQTAETHRWQAEVQTATVEWQRFQQLYQQGAIAASTLDDKELALKTAQAQLRQAEAKQNQSVQSLQSQIRQAQARLAELTEVRPVDVQAAQTEVDQTKAAMQQAQTDLEQTQIRAPMAAQVLKIHVRPGEKLGDAGLVDLAQTHQMVGVAEVYQTDIGEVQMGQAATITSSSLSEPLQGTVSQIGLQVIRQTVFSNEPGENLDRRVVEVKIRLSPQDSRRVRGLTNLQVQAIIHTEAASKPSQKPSQSTQMSSACPGLRITNGRSSFNRVC